MMSDVRAQLTRLLLDEGVSTYDPVADAILERFDVIPKPVVTDEALGRLIRTALGASWYENVARNVSVGADVREELLAAGLAIVRIEGGGE